MCRQFLPKSVFITGASSGLGKALAFEYAQKGMTLHLCGRNQERLLQVAGICTEKGATVYTYLFDTNDEKASTKAVLQADKTKPLDLVIANAGVSGGVLGTPETDESIRQIMKTNIFGVLNTVLPALKCMQKRHKGQVALMASLAGFRGMASCPAYSASKNAVRAMGEALYGQQRPKGITITTICPGFIETPLTDKNQFFMPFLMKPEKAAKIIKTRLQKAPAVIAFPWIMAFGARLGSMLPGWIARPIFASLPKKEK